MTTVASLIERIELYIELLKDEISANNLILEDTKRTLIHGVVKYMNQRLEKMLQELETTKRVMQQLS